MFRQQRVESYSIKEFMARKEECPVVKKENRRSLLEKGVFAGVTIPLATRMMGGYPVMAAKPDNALAVSTAATTASTNAMFDQMLHAFDPLVTLIQALSYPIALVVVMGGAICIMIGKDDRGYTLMQGAGLGYVLVQLTPLILNILVQAMKSV